MGWVDPVVGLRFQAPLNNFVNFTLAGDVGVWGAGSQMDYQIFGALGFRLKPRVLMDVGWRYLFVNYRSSNFVYEAAQTGFISGCDVRRVEAQIAHTLYLVAASRVLVLQMCFKGLYAA